jgi:hypothetical protein
MEWTPSDTLMMDKMKGIKQMSKKELIISGSPRKEGDSEILCKSFPETKEKLSMGLMHKEKVK